MYISKLRLSGFKSFSEDTSISINDGLNGVIGPNGSGKSNIVEAIKWAMGENSSKSLRGSGMNDLIFGGSSSKASKNIALVSLKIEVDNKYFKDINKDYLKDGVIEVERQILRDSGSTYRINGKEVRAKDIQFLFADFSSGSKSSNIIDQGTVGNLVLQKPSERRKILDEAAGISGISARKNETSNKLEATRKNIERLTDILNDKRNNLSELERQAKKAKLYRAAIKNIDELTKLIAIARWKKSKNQMDNISSQLKKDKVNLEKKILKLQEIEKNLTKESIKIVTTEKQKKELEKKNLILNLDIEKINFENTNKQNQLISLENLKDQIEKNLNFQVEIMENANSRLIEIEKEIKTIEKEEIQIEGPNITKEKLEFIKSRNYASVKKIEDLNLKFNDEKQLINQIEFKITLLETKQQESKKQISSTEKLFTDKKNTLNNNVKLNQINKNIAYAKQEIISLSNNISKINEKINKTKLKIDSIRVKIKEDTKIIEDQKNVIYDLEKNISTHISLGFRTTEKSILQGVSVNNGYMLAFCLAIGDGIEANEDKQSFVKWEELTTSEENVSLPNGIASLRIHVSGNKKLNKFLSQVGIVKNIAEGKKNHKYLKNGQILVTKEGALWRWDGLTIIDGKKTLTFKRIESTTKILELEKKIKIEINKLEKIKKEHLVKEKNLEKEQLDLKKSEEQSISLNIKIQEKKNNLNNSEKESFIENNLLKTVKEELLTLEKSIEENKKIYSDSNTKISNYKKKLSTKSSIVLQIRREISKEQIELDDIKKELDAHQINYALYKQQKDTIHLKHTKNLEEVKETKKKLISTNEIIKRLKLDLLVAKKNIEGKKENPVSHELSINNIKKEIENNNSKIEVLSNTLLNLDNYQNEVKDNILLKKNNLDQLKETCIRKDTQVKELNNFLKAEEEKIKNDLDISIPEISASLDKDEKFNINIKDSENSLRLLKTRNEQYSNVNLSAEKDALDLSKEVEEISTEEKDLIKAAKKLEKAIEELNKESRTRIVEAFKEINNTFSTLFKKLFNGGHAYLDLVDSSDPLEAGLELMVSPPGKKLQKLSLLSGGEKALASLALIFSTFINKSSPICILDEVDAPLDEGNVEKFCELLKEATKLSKKRFLIITHNKITMGYMNKLYGVTMLEPGSSKIVSVNLDQAESVYAAE